MIMKTLGVCAFWGALLTAQIGVSGDTIAGRWIGAVQMGDVSPRLVFDISREVGGNLGGTVGSPDSGAAGIPLSLVAQDGSKVTIEAKSANGRFVGDVRDGAIVGIWNDGSKDYPLRLERLTPEALSRAGDPSSLRVASETDHFVFRVGPNDQYDYAELRRLLEQKLQEFNTVLRLTPSTKIDVLVYPNLTEFHRGVFAPNSPDWMVGAAGVNQLKFVTPYNPGPAHSYQSVIDGAVHELVHTLVLRIHRGNTADIPNWLNEGYAYYLAGQLSPTQRQRLLTHYTLATLPSWADLAAMNPSAFGAANGYELSASIVAFLSERFGDSKVTDFLYRPQAFDEVFGQSAATVESAWRGQWQRQ